MIEIQETAIFCFVMLLQSERLFCIPSDRLKIHLTINIVSKVCHSYVVWCTLKYIFIIVVVVLIDENACTSTNY